MNRRNVLASIGSLSLGGLAGCLNNTPSSNEPNSLNSINSIQIDTADEDVKVRYSVEFISREATVDSPVGFTVSVTNNLDETITVSDATDLFFEHVTDESGTFLLLSNSYSEASNENSCWSVDPEQVFQDRESVIEIKPQETQSRDLYIVSYAGCSFTIPQPITFTATAYIHNTDVLSDGQIVNATLQIE